MWQPWSSLTVCRRGIKSENHYAFYINFFSYHNIIQEWLYVVIQRFAAKENGVVRSGLPEKEKDSLVQKAFR